MKVITTEQNPKALGATVPELGIDKLPAHLNLGTYPKTLVSSALCGRSRTHGHGSSIVVELRVVLRAVPAS